MEGRKVDKEEFDMESIRHLRGFDDKNCFDDVCVVKAEFLALLEFELNLYEIVFDFLLEEKPFRKLLEDVADLFERTFSVPLRIYTASPDRGGSISPNWTSGKGIQDFGDLGMGFVLNIERDVQCVAVIEGRNSSEGFRKYLSKVKEVLETVLNKGERLKGAIEEGFKDPLTGVFNRRALERDLSLHEDKGVIFIDVDDFKSINDTYGHLVGDQILKELVKVIRDSIRNSDRIYRYGGDEFLVLLDTMDESVVRIIASRIEKNVKSKISLGGRPITVSTGIAISKGRGVDVLREAEERMYRVKRRKIS